MNTSARWRLRVQYHVQWRSGRHDSWIEARDIPTALLIKFHTVEFQEEMRTKSQEGWCKQPPILGYVRTATQGGVESKVADYDVGCIRPYIWQA